MSTAVGGCGPEGDSALHRTNAPWTISYRRGGSAVTGTGPGSAEVEREKASADARARTRAAPREATTGHLPARPRAAIGAPRRYPREGAPPEVMRVAERAASRVPQHDVDDIRGEGGGESAPPRPVGSATNEWRRREREARKSSVRHRFPPALGEMLYQVDMVR